MMRSTKSKVPSRPSTAASRPRVSFAYSQASRPVLLGQEMDLADLESEEPRAELPGLVDESSASLGLPERLDSQGLVVKDDSQPSGGDGSHLLSPARARDQPRPKTKAARMVHLQRTPFKGFLFCLLKSFGRCSEMVS